jgi:hypothetical protein
MQMLKPVLIDNYYVFEAGRKGLKNIRDTIWLVK